MFQQLSFGLEGARLTTMPIISSQAGTLCNVFICVSSIVVRGGLSCFLRNRDCWKRGSILRTAVTCRPITVSSYANPAFSNLTTSSIASLGRTTVGAYGRLMPCPPEGQPPRIEHIIVEVGGNVVDIISDTLELPRLYVEDLIKFGAVHYSLVCPVPPPTATAEQMALFNKYTTPEILLSRSSLQKKTVQEARKAFRITSGAQELEVGIYLRVHVHPKRCSRCYDVDWKARVIRETDEYVILDKPAGVSVGGSVDNLEETCATFTARALGLAKPLILTHQIDTCTEGCVVLAKTAEFASKFHELLRDRKVKKQYCALAASSVPLGRLTSFMRPGHRTPRVFSKFPFPGWAKCELEVLTCKKVVWPKSSTEEKYGVAQCGWMKRDYAYEVTVKLLTGRTHQIRGQFAAVGAPLVGDSMYMAAAVARLASTSADPFLQESREVDELAVEKWIALHGREPECAIGLQASYLSWGGNGCTSRAGVPWWQT